MSDAETPPPSDPHLTLESPPPIPLNHSPPLNHPLIPLNHPLIPLNPPLSRPIPPRRTRSAAAYHHLSQMTLESRHANSKSIEPPVQMDSQQVLLALQALQEPLAPQEQQAQQGESPQSAEPRWSQKQGQSAANRLPDSTRHH